MTVVFACSISVGGSRTHSKGSLTSEAKVPPESDTDSMAEYGEGEAGSYFFSKFNHFVNSYFCCTSDFFFSFLHLKSLFCCRFWRFGFICFLFFIFWMTSFGLASTSCRRHEWRWFVHRSIRQETRRNVVSVRHSRLRSQNENVPSPPVPYPIPPQLCVSCFIFSCLSHPPVQCEFLASGKIFSGMFPIVIYTRWIFHISCINGCTLSLRCRWICRRRFIHRSVRTEWQTNGQFCGIFRCRHYRINIFFFKGKIQLFSFLPLLLQLLLLFTSSATITFLQLQTRKLHAVY